MCVCVGGGGRAGLLWISERVCVSAHDYMRSVNKTLSFAIIPYQTSADVKAPDTKTRVCVCVCVFFNGISVSLAVWLIFFQKAIPLPKELLLFVNKTWTSKLHEKTNKQTKIRNYITDSCYFV